MQAVQLVKHQVCITINVTAILAWPSCRLTIQTSGETNCSQAEACIKPAAVEVASGDVGNIELSGDGNDDEDGELHGDNQRYATANTHTTSSSTPSKMCWMFRDLIALYNISTWSPRCNCHGSYKLVQCSNADDLSSAECWCTTTNSGNSIVGTKKPFQCSDQASM